MGFGHHRLAFGAAAWAAQKFGRDRTVLFHDVLSVDSPEATLVDHVESMYSHGSRLMTEVPKFLGSIMASSTASGGNANTLRLQALTASLMGSLVTDLDLDSPFIATHPLVGCMAVAAGFTNVINLVVDNHPQWFCIVPGALNLVQGPSLFQEMLRLGVPEDELALAGHWCPPDMVANIPEATQRRIRRKQAQKPIRLLIPVGGAGAQETLLSQIIDICAPLVRQGQLQLFLNAGDHDHIEETFKKTIREKFGDYEEINDVAGLNQFRDRLWSDEKLEPSQPVTLFAYNDKHPAISTTDKLCDVADVLVSKPSEMAFWAVPKLMIRRVGDHEAKSALRAAELGDGTLEVRSLEEIEKVIESSDPLRHNVPM